MDASNSAESVQHPILATTKDSSIGLTRIEGVVIGIIAGFDHSGAPLVVFPGNVNPGAVRALASTTLTLDDQGCEVALMFIQGNPQNPMIIGKIQNPTLSPQFKGQSKSQQQQAHAIIDGERIEFCAKNEIVLRCGKASITLTRAGKVIIRGAYVLSRSSGANRIKGGSVQIN